MARKSNKRKPAKHSSRRTVSARSNRFTAALAPARERELRGEYRAAEQEYREVLNRYPHLIEAYVALARLLDRAERFGEAVACLCEAIRIRPKASQPRLALAELYRGSGKFGEAIACLSDYLVLEPMNVAANYLLGFSYLGDRQITRGIECLKATLRLDSTHAQSWLRLGQAQHVLRHGDASQDAFRQLLRLEPEHGSAWLGLGQVLMRAGDVSQARECFAKAIRIDPTLPDVSTALARSHRYTDQDEEQVALLVGLARQATAWPAVAADYNFAVGKIMDDLHRYDEAFDYYKTGNRLARKVKPRFDGTRFAGVVERIVDTFSAEFFATHRFFGHETETPVFVVGMMRSGSTLVEQILASHPDVFGGDELPYIDELAETLAKSLDSRYPACVSQLQQQRAVELGAQYLRRIRTLNTDATRIVDKMPGNLFHLGFIATLFPNATIVHCQREPMDVALSIYFQQFENGHEWSYSLGEIAAFYRGYHVIMTHWRNVLPLKIFDVPYEELIVNQEAITRALVDHCKLPWNDACLDHAQTSRLVGSASNWQVRQPLYRSSLARWKNYERHLGELREGLGNMLSPSDGVPADE